MLAEYESFCTTLSAPLLHSAQGVPHDVLRQKAAASSSNAHSSSQGRRRATTNLSLAHFSTHLANSLCLILIPSVERDVVGAARSQRECGKASTSIDASAQGRKGGDSIDSLPLLDAAGTDGGGGNRSKNKGAASAQHAQLASKDCVTCILTNWAASSSSASYEDSSSPPPLVYQSVLRFNDMRNSSSSPPTGQEHTGAAPWSVVPWSVQLPMLFECVRKGDFVVAAAEDDDDNDNDNDDDDDDDENNNKSRGRRSAKMRRTGSSNQLEKGPVIPNRVTVRVDANDCAVSGLSWTFTCRLVEGGDAECARVNQHMAITAMAHHSHAVAMLEQSQRKCKELEEALRRAASADAACYAAANNNNTAAGRGGFIEGISGGGDGNLISSSQQQQLQHGGAGGGQRGDVRKPQSILNPAQRVSGKRGRGVKIGGV